MPSLHSFLTFVEECLQVSNSQQREEGMHHWASQSVPAYQLDSIVIRRELHHEGHSSHRVKTMEIDLDLQLKCSLSWFLGVQKTLLT